jgi:hypothetical protein
MLRFNLTLPSASTGKTLVLFGIALAGAFITTLRLLSAIVPNYRHLISALNSDLAIFLVLFAATAAAFLGTLALVRVPKASRPVRGITDVAFFAAGLIASTLGTWMVTGFGLALVTGAAV